MKILVIGSGPTGVHFALSALRKNHTVTMLDFGVASAPIPLRESNFVGLKENLKDPVSYFLGEEFEGAVLPSKTHPEYFNLPVAKNFVFQVPSYFRYTTEGISPLISFAKGGLAEAWTAGCYPLNDAELQAFPFSYDAIAPYYGEVAHRIGIGGERDDLAEYFPHHENLSASVALDANSASLLARYTQVRKGLGAKSDIRMGRSRHAVLTRDAKDRGACWYCGRCLWGCPNGALYTPSLSLSDCVVYRNFSYRPGYFASHFELGSGSLIEDLVAYPVNGGSEEVLQADAYVLACGTLSTSNLVLRSVYRATREIIRLSGLIDNRQVLAPFVNLHMLGRSYSPNCYQYHTLALGMASDESQQYIHGQITPLTTASVHPIVQRLPLDFKSANGIFSSLRSSLGVLNLSFCDRRREENYLTLHPSSAAHEGQQWPELSIHYVPSTDEHAIINGALSKVSRFFFALGAPIIPTLTRPRPLGSSAHYSGTLPMSDDVKPWCLSSNCQSYDIPNMFVVDGAAMPFLPAKNLTFTLMANAIRVAETAF